MDLNDAFGSAFVFSRLGTENAEKRDDDKREEEEEEEEVLFVRETTNVTKPKRKPPEVYVFNLQIGRDDCHLLCMFLLIFIISFILSSRK